jgi:hypothetical protein
MKNSILKTVIMGAIFGALLFFMPFFLLGLFVCFGIFGMMMRRRMHHMGYGFHQFAYADKIRNMNEDEYQNFKSKMSRNHCHPNNYNQMPNNQ